MGLLDSVFDPETLAAVKQLNQPNEDQIRQARNNALMNAGFAMMMNNGGHNKSQAFFNALGNGGMAGMGAYQGTIGEAQKQNQQQLEQGLAVRKLLEEQRQRQAQQAAISQLPEEDRNAIAAGVPYKDIYTERNKGFTLAPGDKRFVNGREIAGIDAKPELKDGYILSDGKGGFAVDENLFRLAKELKATGAPKISVPVNVNTEKTWAGNVAEGLAKNDVAALEAAQTAGERIQNARRVRNLIQQNPITGTGAEARLSFNKALATAGLIDGQQVKTTEDLASILANQTLDAVKTSGLGAGNGFTDKDRQFLERAKSGNLEINAGTLRTLADLNERAGIATIKRGQDVASRLKGNPTMGSVGQSYNFEVPADVLPMPSKPSASNLKKGAIYETPKGNLKWNGLQFEDAQ